MLFQIVKCVHHHFDAATAKRLNKSGTRHHYPTHFAGQNLFPRYIGAGRDVLFVLFDVGTQFGQRAQIVQLRFVHADAKRCLDEREQGNLAQRVHRQIDFKIVVGAGIAFHLLVDVSLQHQVDFALRCIRFVGGAFVGCGKFGQFETLQLHQPCFGQLARHNVNIFDAFVSGHRLVKFGYLLAQNRFHILHRLVAQLRQLGYNNALQHVVFQEYTYFLNQSGVMQYRLFQLFGIDIFAVWRYNNLFDASGQFQAFCRRQFAGIAGVQPAIAQNVGRFLRTIVIALHHVLATDTHFAIFGNAHLDVGHRLAGIPHLYVPRPRKGYHRSRLGHAIAFQHGETQCFEYRTDVGRQSGTATHQIVDVAAKFFVNLAKQHARKTFGTNGFGHAEQRARYKRTFDDVHDAFRQQFVQTRHADDNIYLALVQRFNNAFGIQTIGNVNRFAHIERRHQRPQQRENVM